MTARHYLYRHIRLDKNEPFYIGIGTVYQVDINSSLETVYYKRAYCKQRSGIWYNVTNKTNYIVEIIIESNNYDFIKDKEREFINLYGRKNNNTGCLVNLTDGGEGTNNRVVSQKTKNILKIKATGKKWSDEYKELFRQQKLGKKQNQLQIDNAARGKYKPIIQYDLKGSIIKEWESTKTAGDELCLKRPLICMALRGKIKTYEGFVWKYKNEIL
jgi:hypothetical protein